MISLSAQTELVRLFDEYLRVKYVSRRGRWRNCGVIAAAFDVFRRRNTLEFKHHEIVAALPRRHKWIDPRCLLRAVRGTHYSF
jgi:hypothetical protein